jgi:hypothetical protein
VSSLDVKVLAHTLSGCILVPFTNHAFPELRSDPEDVLHEGVIGVFVSVLASVPVEAFVYFGVVFRHLVLDPGFIHGVEPDSGVPHGLFARKEEQIFWELSVWSVELIGQQKHVADKMLCVPLFHEVAGKMVWALDLVSNLVHVLIKLLIGLQETRSKDWRSERLIGDHCLFPIR